MTIGKLSGAQNFSDLPQKPECDANPAVAKAQATAKARAKDHLHALVKGLFDKLHTESHEIAKQYHKDSGSHSYGVKCIMALQAQTPEYLRLARTTS
jgi:hypothetical protein